jgi:hypothetical protein
MGSSMNVNEQKMLDYYEKLMDQVYLQYHTHPTNLAHIYLTAAESAEMVYYDAMGRNLASAVSPAGKKNKKVHLHTDPNYSNGLPRKK